MSELDLYERLALSILSVNFWSLEKSWQIRDNLRKAGFYDADAVASWDHQTAIEKLSNAGYQRGPVFGSIFASRLQELAFFKRDKGFSGLIRAVESDDKAKAEEILLSIYGVGPAVVRNFWILGEEPSQS